MGDSKLKIAGKHSRTPEQIAEDIKKMELARQSMTKNSVDLELNLREFNSILDPILSPTNDKPLCWVRRPTQKEWEEMVPAELMEYRDAGEVPKEIAKKYSNHQFEMMAKLIDNPKHDAAWWKANSNILFQEMFQVHLLEVYKKLGIDVENF